MLQLNAVVVSLNLFFTAEVWRTRAMLAARRSALVFLRSARVP